MVVKNGLQFISGKLKHGIRLPFFYFSYKKTVSCDRLEMPKRNLEVKNPFHFVFRYHYGAVFYHFVKISQKKNKLKLAQTEYCRSLHGGSAADATPGWPLFLPAPPFGCTFYFTDLFYGHQSLRRTL